MKLLASLIAAVALLSAAEPKLGKPFSVKDPLPVATLVEDADNYAGKIVQVRGKITAVCQMMGCWMELTGDQKEGAAPRVRIQVEDGVIVFPKDSAGKTAIAEGKFSKTELTREQVMERAKEEAAEEGRKFDPAKVKGATTLYQIAGTGAVIRSN